jgi:hypothetical protein
MSEPAGTSPRVARHAFLSPFGTRLPAVAQPDDPDLEASVRRLAERIGAVPRRAVVHLGIRDASGPRSWSLQVGPEGSTVRAERMEGPDLEILTDAETWRRMASGSVSPLVAFGGGGVRVIGDLGVARRLASRLAAREEGQRDG